MCIYMCVCVCICVCVCVCVCGYTHVLNVPSRIKPGTSQKHLRGVTIRTILPASLIGLLVIYLPSRCGVYGTVTHSDVVVVQLPRSLAVCLPVQALFLYVLPLVVSSLTTCYTR